MRGGRQVSAERWQEIGVARTRAADQRAFELLSVIESSRADGARSLREIASALVERRVPAPRGGRWHAIQVKRVLTQIHWYRVNEEHKQRLAALAGE